MTRHICNFCKQSFSQSFNLERHLGRCKIAKEMRMNEYIENLKIKHRQETSKMLVNIEELHKKRDFYENSYNFNVEKLDQYKSENQVLKEQLVSEKKNVDYYKEMFIQAQETCKVREDVLSHQIFKLKAEIDSLNGKNETLKECYEKLAKPFNVTTTNNNTNSHNNTTNNITQQFFFSPEFIEEKIDKNFTKDHVVEMMKGIGMFVKKFIATDENGNLSYYCSDPSRQIFKYVNPDGVEFRDVKAEKIISPLKPNLVQKIEKIKEKQTQELTHRQKRNEMMKEDPDISKEEQEDYEQETVRVSNYVSKSSELLKEMKDKKINSKLSKEFSKVLIK